MNPVLVNVWRGSSIESRHRGAVAVVDVQGRVVFSLGDIQRPEFPRSAIKYLQAIPLLETGAADHFELTPKHISFACASHNAESIHTDFAEEWLSSIDCTTDQLECGAELPGDPDAQFKLIASGGTPRRYHHNCSGKHLGLITTCKHMNESLQNYRLYQHPVQQRWFDVLEALASVKVQQLSWGYDGCGIPTLALPLQRVALAQARFADPSALSSERRSAIERIIESVAAHPYMVAGKERLCTALMELTGKSLLVKIGAEGYYTATVPGKGLGIALKIDDGNHRGSQVALGAVLEKMNLLSAEQSRQLAEYLNPDVTNSRGEVIGRLEPSSEWV
ncbi:MAG: asparaginase [Gammaproteobacteria bacterium]|nr:asparaginase [Gammaproteobacteria bacterium]